MSLVGFGSQNHPQQVSARGSRDDRGTPVELFDPLHERFGFSIDVAASSENAKVPRFFDIEQDGLKQSWAGEVVWCNPPYSDIRPWIEKAWHEPATVVMLLPANRTEQSWWQELIEPYRDCPGSILTVEFLRGRPRFLAPGASHVPPNSRPPFGVCLAIWDRRGPDVRPTRQEVLAL